MLNRIIDIVWQLSCIYHFYSTLTLYAKVDELNSINVLTLCFTCAAATLCFINSELYRTKYIIWNPDKTL